VSFSVVAGGGGPFTYQWRKSSVNIAGATGSSYSVAAVGTSDVGAYDVVVRGACGATVISTPAVLTLLPYLATKIDFDGDGKTDLAIWRPSTGVWWIFKSSNLSTLTAQWGTLCEVPVPGDYSGDGKTDMAVWRPATATFFIYDLATNSSTSKPWGASTDVP